jgi:hypothetical protein
MSKSFRMCEWWGVCREKCGMKREGSCCTAMNSLEIFSHGRVSIAWLYFERAVRFSRERLAVLAFIFCSSIAFHLRA